MFFCHLSRCLQGPNGERWKWNIRWSWGVSKEEIVAKQRRERTSVRVPNDERRSALFSYMKAGSETCSVIQREVEICITITRLRWTASHSPASMTFAGIRGEEIKHKESRKGDKKRKQRKKWREEKRRKRRGKIGKWRKKEHAGQGERKAKQKRKKAKAKEENRGRVGTRKEKRGIEGKKASQPTEKKTNETQRMRKNEWREKETMKGKRIVSQRDSGEEKQRNEADDDDCSHFSVQSNREKTQQHGQDVWKREGKKRTLWIQNESEHQQLRT